jgi:hypothetical protein
MEVLKARNAIETVFTYLETQLPFAYAHLINLLVNLNNMIICIKCGLNFSKANKNYDLQVMFTEALYLIVVPFVYQGLLTISSIIADPFGTDMLDLPIEVFCEHVHKSCIAMELTAQCCPALSQTKASGKNRRVQTGPSLLARENFVELRAAAERQKQSKGDDKELCRELRRLVEVLDKNSAAGSSAGGPRFRPPDRAGGPATLVKPVASHNSSAGNTGSTWCTAEP